MVPKSTKKETVSTRDELFESTLYQYLCPCFLWIFHTLQWKLFHVPYTIKKWTVYFSCHGILSIFANNSSLLDKDAFAIFINNQGTISKILLSASTAELLQFLLCLDIHISVYGQAILWEISKDNFAIPLKICCPYCTLKDMTLYNGRHFESTEI